MQDHLKLRTQMTTAEVEGADESVTVQLPPTLRSWNTLQDIDAETSVDLTSADGGLFTGTVEDWDDAHYTVTVGLS